YDLPNASAYLETCAAIANAFWNERMFRLHGDAKYIDVLERIIYNGFLSGLSMTGNRFFYPNPLESDGKGKFNHGSCERAPWFGCSCCPVNDVRFIPEIASFVYATHGNALYVNLFMGGSAKLDLAGTILEVKQVTRYPWDGKVTLTMTEVARPDSSTSGQEFTLNLRIPGWARNQPLPSDLYRYDDALKPQVTLAVNGQPLTPKLEKGFAQITRVWEAGDTVTLEMEMPVRRVVAHPAVVADRNRFALERGPLVYCAEGADNAGQVLDKIFPGKVRFQTQERSNLLGGIVTVKLTSQDSPDALTCIPYYAWCHRGANEMRVWFPTKAEPKLASHCWELDSVAACFDGREPKSSDDGSIPRFTWWDHRGTSEWVVRTFEKPTQVSAASVYWFDDTGSGSCRVPKSWRLLYQDGKEWKPVAGASAFGTQLNQYNRVTFNAVTTTVLRLEVQLQPEFSGGILEWK
ncbi:MAG TPA: beta-L-arabinofuranosidase domain-containing protein, partial [Candidatus Sulfotelmatobacter sp.]|nr:beta-L-arabinofuranosidase domain-containing protein [Candidatus Sulfotelmatobacter sp.]